MAEEFFAGEEARLDEAAAGEFGFLSIGSIRRAIESGAITLNGRRAGPGDSVVPGDLVTLQGEGLPEITPVARTLHVLYEDNSLIAVDKPAGVSVVPERGRRAWPFMGMLLYHAETCPLCGGARFRVVHRLDRDTTGAVVVAKTLEAGRALSAAFAGREVEKRYSGIVAGEPAEDAGTIEVPIAASKRKNTVMEVTRDGKPSVTKWEVLERFRGYALVEARPLTGRTHQIRVHLSWAGMPLAVDEAYGGAKALFLSAFKKGYKKRGEEKALISRLTLHCRALSFRHPVTRERVSVEAALPEDFDRALKSLRKHARE